MDSYERRVFLTMLGFDQQALAKGLPLAFGYEGFSRFIAARCPRFPHVCWCGYRSPGPFPEMHIHRLVPMDGPYPPLREVMG